MLLSLSLAEQEISQTSTGPLGIQSLLKGRVHECKHAMSKELAGTSIKENRSSYFKSFSHWQHPILHYASSLCLLLLHIPLKWMCFKSGQEWPIHEASWTPYFRQWAEGDGKLAENAPTTQPSATFPGSWPLHPAADFLHMQKACACRTRRVFVLLLPISIASSKMERILGSGKLYIEGFHCWARAEQPSLHW